jgi:DNA-binding PadR family transcriptional regulator
MKDDLTALLPLTPAILHILLALAGEDRHGYGIMQEVARQSEGTCKLGPGTLYDNLQRLVEGGLIQESSGKSADENSRRRYYRLTTFGRRVLSAEVVRLGRVLREAKAHVRATSLVKVS